MRDGSGSKSAVALDRRSICDNVGCQAFLLSLVVVRRRLTSNHEGRSSRVVKADKTRRGHCR